MAKATTQVNTPAPAGVSTEMPDFLKKQGSGLGNEGVNAADLVIPRLGIIQSTSPELDADDLSKYIPGAKLGQIFNTLTRELFDSITTVDCFFRKEFVVFVKRTAGGGFRGAHATQADAVAAVESSDKPQDMEIVETGNHFCLVVDPTNLKVLGEVVIPMTSTKLKISRTWNSMIRMRGGDRFAGTWTLSTKKEKNDKGTYYNFAVVPGPWVNEALYNRAKETYEAVVAGVKDVDRSEPLDTPSSDRF